MALSTLPAPTSLSRSGKRGTVIGITNDQGIDWDCALALQGPGPRLTITCLNDQAHGRPGAEAPNSSMIAAACAVEKPGELKAVRSRVMARAAAGFARARGVSCPPFLCGGGHVRT